MSNDELGSYIAVRFAAPMDENRCYPAPGGQQVHQRMRYAANLSLL